MAMKTLQERQTIVNLLKSHVVTVVFEKKDGTERVMMATLKEGIAVFPEKKEGSVEPVEVPLEQAQYQKVWDTEANGWRQFNWDTLKSVIVGDATKVIHMVDMKDLSAEKAKEYLSKNIG